MHIPRRVALRRKRATIEPSLPPALPAPLASSHPSRAPPVAPPTHTASQIRPRNPACEGIRGLDQGYGVGTVDCTKTNLRRHSWLTLQVSLGVQRSRSTSTRRTLPTVRYVAADVLETSRDAPQAVKLAALDLDVPHFSVPALLAAHPTFGLRDAAAPHNRFPLAEA